MATRRPRASSARARRPSAARPGRGLGFDDVRALGRALPGVEEGTSYGTPALRVRGTLLARLREDGETLVVKTDADERDLLMQTDPATFFTTDHYAGYAAVLVRLATVERELLRGLLEQAWRAAAPKRVVAAYDAEPGRARRQR